MAGKIYGALGQPCNARRFNVNITINFSFLGSPPAPVHIINLNGPVDGPCARIYNRKDYYANQVFCVAQIVTRGKVYRCRGTSTVRPGNTI